MESHAMDCCTRSLLDSSSHGGFMQPRIGQGWTSEFQTGNQKLLRYSLRWRSKEVRIHCSFLKRTAGLQKSHGGYAASPTFPLAVEVEAAASVERELIELFKTVLLAEWLTKPGDRSQIPVHPFGSPKVSASSTPLKSSLPCCVSRIRKFGKVASHRCGVQLLST